MGHAHIQSGKTQSSLNVRQAVHTQIP